jgi:hypothetical protein
VGIATGLSGLLSAQTSSTRFALSGGHVILEHVEIFPRFPLALLTIDVNVVVGPPPADFDRLLDVGHELAEE